MTRSIAVAVLLVLLVFSFASAREWVPFSDVPVAEEVVSRVVSTDVSATVIDIEIPGMLVEPTFRGMPGSVDLAIPGARPLSSPGMPNLPVLSYMLAVPNSGNVRLEVVALEERVIQGYDVAPASPFELEGREPVDATTDPAVYSTDAFYPADAASIGEPGVLRDLRLVSVRVNPVRYNPVTRELLIAERLQVRVVTDEGPGANPKRVERDFRSAAFEPIYAAVVDNYDQLPRAEIRRGSYLVITVDDYVASLNPFVEWKRQRGVETELVPLSTIGSSPTNQDIKDYIQNAYDTWPNPPDYVLLVGDSTTSGSYGTMPCWYLPAIPFNHVIDHPYAELDGGDYFPDVIVGRMSVDSPTDAVVATLKVLSYERDCDGPNNTWYKNALMVAGNYGATPPPTSPRQTVLRVREMLYDCDYAQVDTVFYPPYITPNPIGSMIDAGVGIVNYRGWGNDAGWHYPEYYTDDINALSNGNALPIMTSCVCGSNAWESWGYDPCFGEAWIRSGSPGNLKGGPAMLGPSDRNTHTRWNNAMGSGIYQGMLYEGLEHFGQVLVRGKLEVWKWFIDERDPDDWVEYYHNIYSVMGDPELWLRLDSPETFIVSHAASEDLGQNNLLVEVTDSMGNVVPGAEVTLYMENEFIETRTLTGDSRVLMPMPAETAGTVNVTVVAKDYVPYTGECEVDTPARYVGYYNHSIDDDGSAPSSGNGDGVINPGETVALAVTLKNYGTDLATGVTCSFEMLQNSPWVSVVTPQTATYGSISGGGTASGSQPFVFEVQSGCPDDMWLFFLLTATDASRGTYTSEVRVQVGAPTLSYYTMAIGGDGVLDPGETATLTVTLANDGPAAAGSVTGTLRTPTSGLTAGDAAGAWGTVAASGMATNSGNTFQVTAAAGVAVGHEFLLAIDLAGDDGLAQYVVFPLVVGTVASNDPGGPDAYGYYCYDDTDSRIQRGADLLVGRAGSVLRRQRDRPGHGLRRDDRRRAPVHVPVLRRGVQHDRRLQQRRHRLRTAARVGEAAAQHDDRRPLWARRAWPLRSGTTSIPNAAGKVLYQNLGGGRFVVEWSRVQSVYLDGMATPYLQTFELILYDQDVYSTETGDGEILFQYHTIANADTANGATVGIENLNQTDGLEYSFFRMYPDHAAPLASDRAVKFTTDPPDSYPSTGVEEAVTLGVKILGNRPNPFNP